MVESTGSINEGCRDGIDGTERWSEWTHYEQEPQGRRSAVATRPAKGLTRAQLVRVASGMLGLMFGWATKTVLTTPLFRDIYGVDPANLGFVWVAGPLSGLVVQPVIGVISDHREGQGQRSFFFAGGAVLMAASLALLPAAGAVWRYLGLAGTTPSDSKKAGTGLAVVALWMLDLAMNASLVAIRAVVADCAPPWQQAEANTVILISYGAGMLLGYAFGTLDSAGWFGLPLEAFWKTCVDFWVAAVFLLVSAAVASVEAFRLEQSRERQSSGLFQALSTMEQEGSGDANRTHSEVTLGEGDVCYGVLCRGVPPLDITSPARVCAAADEGLLGRRRGAFVDGGGGGGDVCGAVVDSVRDQGAGGSAWDGSINGVRMASRGEDVERGKSLPEDVVPATAAMDVDLGLLGCVECKGEERSIPARLPAPVIGGFMSEEAGTGDTRGGDESASSSSLKVRIMDMMLFYDLPSWLRPVCFLLFCSWVGWFAIIIFGSDWVGVNIFGGDPSAPSGDDLHQAYEDGVAWASVGLAVQAVVVTAMGCGPVTFLVRKAGLRGGFLAAISIQSACLLLATFLGQDAAGRISSLVIFAALGMPLALIETLPYMMVGIFSLRDSHGQLLGKLNVWIVLAQLALTLCIHPIVQHTQNSDSAVILAGSVVAAAGLMFVPGIGKKRIATTPSTGNAAVESGDVSPASPRRLLVSIHTEPGETR